jgi:SAM-dependent methyltransferase
MAETTLIQKMNGLGVFPQEWKTEEEVRANEARVEEISDELFAMLSPDEIIEHNIAAYDASTEAYDNKPANQKVVPELLQFINHLADESLVLDLGSGHGRDSLYMVDPSCREELNREGMVSLRIYKAFKVVPLDGSEEFLGLTYDKLKDHLKNVPLMVQGDFTKPGEGRVYNPPHGRLDYHLIATPPLVDSLIRGNLRSNFDAIWSCASFLIHMPEQYLDGAIDGWGQTLTKDGLFAVSYIPPRKEGQTTQILASRSAPGEIKVFSHYTPERIDEAFAKAGFELANASTGDFAGRGHVQSKFFGNAFYRKL